MKTFKLFFCFLLLSSISTFAQYQYNGYDSSMGRGHGRGSIVQTKDLQDKPSAEDTEKMREERIDRLMVKLKAELELDELQAIAIRNELISNDKNIAIVLKKENSEEAKTEEIKALREKLEANTKSYLSDAQKEKFALFMADPKSSKKEKKSKKDKKAEEQP